MADTTASKTIRVSFIIGTKGAQGFVKDTDKMSKSVGRLDKKQMKLRISTAGLRRSLGAVRNQLLIVTFAFAGLVRGIASMIKNANQLQSALTGLVSVARNVGASSFNAAKAAKELADTGLISVTQAAASLKNLLATGIGLDKAKDLMIAFTDAAAFNRQGQLGLGQAVEGATEGFKNMLCLSGETKILNMNDGEFYTLEELHDNRKEVPSVLSMDRSTGELKVIQATYLHYNGERPVYEIETENGVKIKATSNHRFLTQDGFKFLDELDEDNDVLYYSDEEEIRTKVKEIINWEELSKKDVSCVEGNCISKEQQSVSNAEQLYVNSVVKSLGSKNTLLRQQDFVAEAASTNGSMKLELEREKARKLANKLNVNVELAERCLQELRLLSREEVGSIVLRNASMKTTEESIVAKTALVLLEELKLRVSGVGLSDKSLQYLRKNLGFVPESVEESGSQLECQEILTQTGKAELQEKGSYLLSVESTKSGENLCMPEMSFDVLDVRTLLEEILTHIIWLDLQKTEKNTSPLSQKTGLPYAKHVIDGFIQMLNSVVMKKLAITPTPVKIRKISYSGVESVYDLTVPESYNFSVSIITHNSMKVDNVGITKNLSVMEKEYADALGKTIGNLSEAERRMAHYVGILKEAKNFEGDRIKVMGLLQGQLSKLGTTMFNMSAALGTTLQPALTVMVKSLGDIATKTQKWAEENKEMMSGNFIAFVGFLNKLLGSTVFLVGNLAKFLTTNLGSAMAQATVALIAFNAAFIQLGKLLKLGIVMKIVNLFKGLVFWIKAGRIAMAALAPILTVVAIALTAIFWALNREREATALLKKEVNDLTDAYIEQAEVLDKRLEAIVRARFTAIQSLREMLTKSITGGSNFIDPLTDTRAKKTSRIALGGIQASLAAGQDPAKLEARVFALSQEGKITALLANNTITLLRAIARLNQEEKDFLKTLEKKAVIGGQLNAAQPGAKLLKTLSRQVTLAKIIDSADKKRQQNSWAHIDNIIAIDALELKNLDTRGKLIDKNKELFKLEQNLVKLAEKAIAAKEEERKAKAIEAANDAIRDSMKVTSNQMALDDSVSAGRREYIRIQQEYELRIKAINKEQGTDNKLVKEAIALAEQRRDQQIGLIESDKSPKPKLTLDERLAGIGRQFRGQRAVAGAIGGAAGARERLRIQQLITVEAIKIMEEEGVAADKIAAVKISAAESVLQAQIRIWELEKSLSGRFNTSILAGHTALLDFMSQVSGDFFNEEARRHMKLANIAIGAVGATVAAMIQSFGDYYAVRSAGDIAEFISSGFTAGHKLLSSAKFAAIAVGAKGVAAGISSGVSGLMEAPVSDTAITDTAGGAGSRKFGTTTQLPAQNITIAPSVTISSGGGSIMVTGGGVEVLEREIAEMVVKVVEDSIRSQDLDLTNIGSR